MRIRRLPFLFSGTTWAATAVWIVLAIAVIGVFGLPPLPGVGDRNGPAAALFDSTPLPTSTPGSAASPTVSSAVVTPTASRVPPATFTPASSPSPAPGGSSPASQTVIVQPGDTLSAIATRIGVPVEELVRRNGLPGPNAIVAGSPLIVAVGVVSPGAGLADK